MVSLTDEKRAALAEKLAGMKAIQDLIISNEQEFINQCDDTEIRDRLQKMLSDDQKNLGIIETAITQYGIQSEPKDKVQQMVQKAEEMMSGSDLTMYEKMAQHELLKHGQVMSGLIVHKAAQIVGADVQAALAPINTVNFENRAHQEQLKGVLEVLGTRELTGEEADQGLWSRVQDAISALTGVVGSVATQNSDQSDLKIQDIIRMDHQKVNVLIGEIEQSNDNQKIQEYFGQLYQDLLVHSVAEEQVVYPTVRPFYGDEDTQELYDEQAQLREILDQMKSLEPDSQEFKDMLQQVKEMVGDHTRQEESTMFSAIKSNCSSQQQQQMATEFKEAKKQLQLEMAG
ncbi:Hemerythrin HHE cation binding domain protein [Stanieria cyanosphaera PCC 7437]|uniref:Hemerythrin HHE cation binding domain protein n=1 Tax=Stanieria cyanosphaera (strain ATCC 29371 / PCC 7437) TaxID=111780 RepID=K9XMN5_STAC7|nr:hemerythrin domain-containing protein [Stanieria cyanosphaera]AFZ33758.1 Hemerythrin HHE cation binding domain protein [Stanieria cyanosphaera PCC 7437]